MPGALERTYYTDVDYVLDNSSATNFAKNWLWAIAAALLKNILTTNAGAVSAWTCIGSSDSVTAALDGTNRWGTSFDSTKIVLGAVNGTNVNSWIVLKHPTDAIYLTLQYLGSALNTAVIVISKNLPTGGTTSSRPTSTSEMLMLDRAAFCDNSATAGKAHRVFDSEAYPLVCMSRVASGRILCGLVVAKLAETKSGDTEPWVAFWDQGSAASAFLGANTTNTQAGTGVNQWRNGGAAANGPGGRAYIGGSASVVVPAFLLGSGSTIFFGNTMTGVDAVDSKYDDFPLYVVGSISGSYTIKGRLYDWRQCSASLNDLFPAAAPSQTHLCIGTCWVPFTAVPSV